MAWTFRWWSSSPTPARSPWPRALAMGPLAPCWTSLMGPVWSARDRSWPLAVVQIGGHVLPRYVVHHAHRPSNTHAASFLAPLGPRDGAVGGNHCPVGGLGLQKRHRSRVQPGIIGEKDAEGRQKEPVSPLDCSAPRRLPRGEVMLACLAVGLASGPLYTSAAANSSRWKGGAAPVFRGS